MLLLEQRRAKPVPLLQHSLPMCGLASKSNMQSGLIVCVHAVLNSVLRNLVPLLAHNSLLWRTVVRNLWACPSLCSLRRCPASILVFTVSVPSGRLHLSAGGYKCVPTGTPRCCWLKGEQMLATFSLPHHDPLTCSEHNCHRQHFTVTWSWGRARVRVQMVISGYLQCHSHVV